MTADGRVGVAETLFNEAVAGWQPVGCVGGAAADVFIRVQAVPTLPLRSSPFRAARVLLRKSTNVRTPVHVGNCTVDRQMCS